MGVYAEVRDFVLAHRACAGPRQAKALPANVLASTRCDERPSRCVFGDLEPQLLDGLRLLVQRLRANSPRSTTPAWRSTRLEFSRSISSRAWHSVRQ